MAVTIQSATPFTLDDQGRSAWDSVRIAGIDWYGKFEIKGAKRAYNWQINNGMGFYGATEILKGLAVPQFTITFYCWANDAGDSPNSGGCSNYREWQELIPRLEYSKASVSLSATTYGANVKGIDIYHPSLVELGIYQLIVIDIGPMEKQSEDKLFAATVTVCEFYTPIPITPAAPDASSNSEDLFAPTPEQIALQAQIAIASGQLQALGTKGRTPKTLPTNPPPFGPH